MTCTMISCMCEEGCPRAFDPPDGIRADWLGLAMNQVAGTAEDGKIIRMVSKGCPHLQVYLDRDLEVAYEDKEMIAFFDYISAEVIVGDVSIEYAVGYRGDWLR